MLSYYRALWEAGVQVDVVAVTAELSGYDVVVAPALHMLRGDLVQRLEEVAAAGGSVVTTFLSGRVDQNDNAFLMDVPGPLGTLMGVRVDEWDARGPETVNPVRLRSGTIVDSRLIFELVFPQGAEVMGTYQADFYAGTAAVTRNTFGAGHGWYVGAGLDQAGVSWVIRRVLEKHDLLGAYSELPDLETAVRIAPDGRRVLFLLNHGVEAVDVIAQSAGVDLLTGKQVAAGQQIRLRPSGVHVQTAT